ncbi:hypothetical protein LOZ12_006031 [Ophidiomyces ophidiicola]|nr:hypothetical protein LOZ62_002601 [Ophidiomyces ophidiicola]KAI2053974.1 hypothetical protein LOZ38_001503 [Ophidiomyces ophidiicola]KAI2075028.1 hypothetical protein LOZ37_003642 [Ophidiomyces ophidiicola]KAI2076683.1 hypothetical protein LOZ39_002587 [Ophidiomyces ophidiicola]KAI2093929.1 hypothetical protein LOZ35_004050 [Ophidiomyces ophidiicola]
MATDNAAHINGNYAQQPVPYNTDPYHAANMPAPHQPGNASTPAPPPHDPKDIPKEEVAWFFVELYYNTMSRSPDKLHLFYSRKSQFVAGNEAETVGVSVGQNAIRERLGLLNYQDTKVRVLNVDSQSSFDNIVVCVIGELSNKNEPARKFVQTFVLAEQRNGYYVLNDVIRFLVDDDEEEEEEEIADEQTAQETVVADTQVEPAKEDAPPPKIESQSKDVEAKAPEAEDPALLPLGLEPKTISAPVQVAATPQTVPVSVDALQKETPKEPEPTPVASSPKPVTPAVEKENVPPAKPTSMTWASIASSNTSKSAATAAATAAAVVPVATLVAVPNPAPAPQPKAAPAPAEPAPTTNGETAPSQTSSSSGSEWQTAGRGRDDNTLGYIKSVNDKVDAAHLKQTLQRFGKLKYFDVNRHRGCAFIEFADAAGYKAAVAANPHQIGTERIVVEERRRTNNYSGNTPFGAGRGGATRGRGDRTANQGRGGFQKDSGRYTPRGGRGGTMTPKGRPQSQAA